MSTLKFPRLVFQSKDGKTFEHHLVEEQEAHDEKLANGWHSTVPDALAAAVRPAVAGAKSGSDGAGDPLGAGNNQPPTRAELEEQARKLGLSFQPNIGDKKLRNRIEIALQGGGQ